MDGRHFPAFYPTADESEPGRVQNSLLFREAGKALGCCLPGSCSRAQTGLEGVAGQPGSALVARGDCFWGHPSLSPLPDHTELGQSKGWSLGNTTAASSSGSVQGTMALSLPGHYLHASSSQSAKRHCVLRGAGSQEMQPGAGPGKGPSLPQAGPDGTEVTG